MIQYVKGDATNPLAKGRKIIAHIVNDQGMWGKGFVMALSKHWPEPEAKYREWSRKRVTDYGIPFRLGKVQMVKVREDLFVANMLAQKGLRQGTISTPLRYHSLEECLYELGSIAWEMGCSIHMPKIGTGLGGGKWEKIEPIITDALNGIDVTVYELP